MARGIVAVDREPGERTPKGDKLIAVALARTGRLDGVGIADELEFAAEIEPPIGRGQLNLPNWKRAPSSFPVPETSTGTGVLVTAPRTSFEWKPLPQLA